MGKRTVRWKDLKGRQPGQFSCDKCNNIGIIQDNDPRYGTHYYYCDCYYGKEQKRKMEEGKRQ